MGFERTHHPHTLCAQGEKGLPALETSWVFRNRINFCSLRKRFESDWFGPAKSGRLHVQICDGVSRNHITFLTLQPRIFGYQSQFRWYSQKFSATNHHFHGVAKNYWLPITISMV